MMKRGLILTVLFAASSLLSGCLAYTCGYCDNDDVQQRNVPEVMKFPVSYSVKYLQSDGSEYPVFGKEEEDFRREVGDALKRTGLFSRVKYSNRADESEYHIAFRFWRSGTSRGDAVTVGLISGYTLMLIPTGEELTLDASANITLRGKPVVGLGEAESAKVIYWLPFLPFFISGLVFVDNMDDNVLNSIVNDVAKYHYDNFVRQSAPSAARR